MSGARDVFFTRTDEAALSFEIRKKYPKVKFFEHRDWYADSIPPTIESIDVATVGTVDFAIVDDDWRPQLKKLRSRDRYFICNFPELHGQIARSGGVWWPRQPKDDYEPRGVGEGRVHIFYDPRPNKAQISFQRAIWLRFKRFATWRLQPYDPTTWRPSGWEKTDKEVWAGNDAIRWAKESRSRSFPSNSTYRYRPIQ